MKHLLARLICAALLPTAVPTAIVQSSLAPIQRSVDVAGRIEAVLALARAARARFDYAGALRMLYEVSDRENHPRVLVERGEIFLDAEDLVRARDNFQAAVEEESSNADAIVGLAAVELLGRSYSAAEGRLRLLLARKPQHAPAHARLSQLLLDTDHASEAAAEALRATALDSHNVQALTTLALVRARERKPAEVRMLARRVISLDEFNGPARRLLSQYLDGKSGYELQVPDAARRLYDRGRALKQQGKILEAVAELEAALRVEPRYYKALLSVADIWLKKGDYERAAKAARLAESVDADGALPQLQLSYAYRGIKERGRIEIGAPDFGVMSGRGCSAPSLALTREIFPDYGSLSDRGRKVIDSVVAPFAEYLPKLARARARHYLLGYDQRPSEVRDLRGSAEERTLDGRYYDSIRGVGGRITVSGFEYLETAASGGVNTIAHEFAHQVHLTAMSRGEARTIHKLYERARREGRALDYYAAANELEYFAQGYEAFISDYKRPAAGVTARHTSRELLSRDPELYGFLVRTCGKR